jgi:hypothetical protein
MSASADLALLDRDLLQRVDALLLWLGLDGRRVGRRWRGGPPGGRIEVVLSGSHAGSWGAWSAGKTGRGLTGLIAYAHGIRFGDAAREAREFLGEPEPADNRRPEPEAADGQRADNNGIRRARRIAARLRGIHRTAAERYVIETRGIPRPDGGWPHTIAYDPRDCALAAIVTNAGGEIVATHRVFLTPAGTKIDDAEVERRKLRAVKRTDGPKSAGTLYLRNTGAGPLCVVEGLETGLAVYASVELDVLVLLGHFAHARRLPPGREIIACVEEDLSGSQAAETTRRRLAELVHAGHSIALAWPRMGRPKADLADVIRELGAEAVRERIWQAETIAPQPQPGSADEPPDSAPGWDQEDDTAGASRPHPGFDIPTLNPCAPPRPLPTGTLANAYTYHAGTMLKFYAPVAEGEFPPQVHMGGQGGTGKTETAIRFAREGIGQAQEDGIMVLMPEHKVLGRQLLDRYAQATGFDVAPLLGRGDPFNPKDDDLCTQPQAVAEALKAGLSISKSVCGPDDDGSHCPDLPTCQYQVMKARAAAAKVKIAAHNYLTLPLPKAVAESVGRLVVEEEFAAHTVWIFDLTLDTFGPAALDQWPVLYEDHHDVAATKHLARLYQVFIDACGCDGDLTAEKLRDAGLHPYDFDEAIRLSRQRGVKSTMKPGMSLDARREAAAREAINGQMGKIVTAWTIAKQVFEGTAPGRITVQTVTRKRGISREITVHTMHRLADWTDGLPTLLVNSSPQHEIAREFFPRLIERAPDDVAVHHVTNRLIVGGFAKGTLERSARKRRELNRFLKLEAIGQDKTGFVGFKGTKDEIAAGVPGLIARHHLQNAGDDELRDVSVHTSLDGIRLKTADLVKLVRAKTGRRPSEASPAWAIGSVLKSDGTGVEVPDLRYEDPDMQAEYAAHLYSSVAQAGSARARAVTRTALNPLRNNIFGRLAPPAEVFTEVVHWRDVSPGRLGEMVIRGFVHLNAATMTAMYPDLFPTEKAASRAREDFGDIWQRLRAWVERDRRPWVRVRWQRAGQGHALQWSICPEAEAETLRAAVEALGGEPVHWQVESFTEGQKHPPAAFAEEDIPADVEEDLTEPGMSSPEAPLWPPGESPDRPYRVDHPPDG